LFTCLSLFVEIKIIKHKAISPARIAQMWPISKDVAHSAVCVSVCRCVWPTGELCKNGWTDRDAV